MQLICETYDVMKRVLGMSNAEMHDVFAEWNAGELDSYLIEITRDILAYQRRRRRAHHRHDPRCRRPEGHGQMDGDRSARPGHSADADRRGGVRARAVGSEGGARRGVEADPATTAADSRASAQQLHRRSAAARCTRRRSSATRRVISCCAQRRKTNKWNLNYGGIALGLARRLHHPLGVPRRHQESVRSRCRAWSTCCSIRSSGTRSTTPAGRLAARDRRGGAERHPGAVPERGARVLRRLSLRAACPRTCCRRSAISSARTPTSAVDSAARQVLPHELDRPRRRRRRRGRTTYSYIFNLCSTLSTS